MAAAGINDPRLEDFTCSVCFEVFEEPVSLPCGHTFCKSCIDSTWQGEHNMFSCPNCRTCFASRPNLQRNVVIAAATRALTGLKISNADVPPEPPKPTSCDSCLDTNTPAIKICLKCEMCYCEAHVKAHENLKGRHVMISVMGGGGLDGLKCPQHEEFFTFYCKDDKTFICTTCAMAGKHANHKVSSVEDAMMEMKVKKIPSEQKKVLGMKKYASNMLKHSSRTTTEVQTSIGNMKSEIEDVQRKLTVRLAEEKAECVRELDHLEGIFMGNVKTASQVFQSRLSELNHMEKKLKDFDEEKNSLVFLKDFDEFLTSVENVRKNNPDPCKTSTSLTQQSILDSYCNNLFGAMLECVYGRTPTIAATTCHVNMKYSEDLTAVTATKLPQPYEDLPSRFILWGQVMASKGFHCGRHYWVVDVSKADQWSVGIAYSSLSRRKLGNDFKFGQNALSWCLYKESRCIAKSNGKEWQVPHQQGMKKVGLFLDFNLGSLIFYNAETMASLFQFRARFTEPVFPVLTVVKCDHSLGFVKLEKE